MATRHLLDGEGAVSCGASSEAASSDRSIVSCADCLWLTSTPRKGLVVVDNRGNHFTVLGSGETPGTLSLRSVVTKTTYINVPLAEVTPVPGLIEKG